MINIIDPRKCCGCHSCMTACPNQCITMIPDSEGFLYPQIDQEYCIDCGICEKVCPMLTPVPQGEVPDAFAVWHCDDTIRLASSSGGVFSALVDQVIHQKGVAWGAAFDNNNILCHQEVERSKDIVKLRGSKYLQSIIGDSYNAVQTYLKEGRNVLFSGTPCQVAGLYAFLGRDDCHLITCDVVCHGVPSPKVFTAYKEHLEGRFRAVTRRIAFRDKQHGWKRFAISLLFDNNTEYHKDFTEDPFMIGFLKNTYLRPSCHGCLFSRLPRVADISLGDYWGVEKHHPEWDDDKGTSLVLLQTDKGKKFFQACQKNLIVHTTDLETAIQSNQCICGSVPPGSQRDAFFKDMGNLPFEKLMKKYMHPQTRWRKSINKAKRITKKGLYLLGRG